VVGVIVAAALATLAPPLTRAMAGDTGLAGEAGLYLLIFAVGLPLAGVMGALRSALAGMGRTKATMRVAVVVNLVNIPIDVVLVYGLGLGVAGAAAGTVLAQAAGAGGLAWYVWRRMPAGAGRKPIPRGWREELPRLWRIGWPETVMLTTGYLTTVLVAAIVAGLGVVDLAAWSILGRVLPVLWTVIYACSSGVAIAVGQRLGASDPAGTDAAIRAGWRVTGWLAAAIVTPVVLMPGLVFGLFTDDGAVVAAAVASRLYLFGQAPLMVATMVYSGALRAGGDTRSIMVAATVGNYLCALPASWVLAVPAGLGLNGVFLGQFGYWVLRLGITYRRYAAGGWRDPSPSHGQAG
jgi:multidrug resistance protein, MATE family